MSSLGSHQQPWSGGEAQRVKLASELRKKSTGRTLYLLDEPTTGLHFQDIRTLLQTLDRLVEQGNSVLVIEHNLDVLRFADQVIELGPGEENLEVNWWVKVFRGISRKEYLNRWILKTIIGRIFK